VPSALLGWLELQVNSDSTYTCSAGHGRPSIVLVSARRPLIGGTLPSAGGAAPRALPQMRALSASVRATPS
jgi:hypothetical protein